MKSSSMHRGEHVRRADIANLILSYYSSMKEMHCYVVLLLHRQRAKTVTALPGKVILWLTMYMAHE
jgi:hypothetical protein